MKRRKERTIIEKKDEREEDFVCLPLVNQSVSFVWKNGLSYRHKVATTAPPANELIERSN